MGNTGFAAEAVLKIKSLANQRYENVEIWYSVEVQKRKRTTFTKIVQFTCHRIMVVDLTVARYPAVTITQKTKMKKRFCSTNHRMSPN